MKSLILKIILIGLFFGFLGCVSTMTLGIVIFYFALLFKLMLPLPYLNYAAASAIVIGLVCTFAWYIYILILSKQYVVHLLNKGR